MANKDELIKINNYWLSEFGYLEEDYPTCFVCGETHHLEVCHLIPKALGGTKDPDNVVLLCRRCHSKAPNITIPQIMLNWIHKETEKYDLLFHIKKEDLMKRYKYTCDIYTRLANRFNNNNNIVVDADNMTGFIESKCKKDTLPVGQFYEANVNTYNLYLKYLSEYKDLELDYLEYLLSEKE